MTQLSYAADQRALRIAKFLGGLAILAALIAAVSGIVLLVAGPESGSTLESTLGFIAAAAGVSTAVFAVAALIYAQAKNLWQYAPSWVRVAAWVILGAAALFAVFRSTTQN